ncbi:MAG: hypothetical protein KTR32_18150 [Granulosicoccus sp.]|nr:hypothetical protein [Granulosicoccus sp.]
MHAIAKSLMIVVGIPTLVAGNYLGFFASDVYVSEASFAIRSAQAAAQPGGLTALLASPIVAAGSQDSMLVSEYIHSHDMMQKLQQDHNIRRHYSDESIDLLSRLDARATEEQMRDYYREKISVLYESQSDVLTLKVRAFDAKLSQQIASSIISISEALINDISDRMEDDALLTARAELDRAIEQVNVASEALSEFRGNNSSMNPVAETQAQFGVVSTLEQRITEVQAELAEKRAFMRDDSAEVISLRNRLNALSMQLKIEKAKLLGGADGQSSDLIANYQPLALAQELAQQQYASALGSLEMARLEAQRKKLYLVSFIEPSLPDEAVEPERLLETLTVAVFSFVLFLIGGLMWSALQDHIGK